MTSAAGAVENSQLTASELLYYTTGSGTSFSAPQVAGVIALMLEANPNLSPAQIRDILQRTATALPPYYLHEVGAGMLNAQAAVLEAAFPQRRFGQWRGVAFQNQVQFLQSDPQTFSGSAGPGSSNNLPISLPANVLRASVQIAWGGPLSASNLNLALMDSQGTQAIGDAASLPGLTGRRQRTTVNMPAAGTWIARVSSVVGPAGAPLTNGGTQMAGQTQNYVGTVQVTSAQYPALTDLGGLDSATTNDIWQNFRSLVMSPIGSRFRGSFAVTRADLARAMVVGGRVPQYLPAQSSYSDVRDRSTMLFVESAQNSPNGAMFPTRHGWQFSA